MNKNLLSILLVMFIATFAVGQEPTKSAMAGEWMVIQVVSSSVKFTKEEKQVIETMKKGYLNSKFNFKANGRFFIVFRKDAPEFMNHLKVLNNKGWVFNDREKLVSIGTRDDNYNHLRMYVKKSEGRTFFAFNDIPLILEMKKL